LTLDTPLTTLAKYGIVGGAAVLLSLASVFQLARALRLRGFDRSASALVGFLAVVVGSLVVSSPAEDKGLAFGLILLLGYAAATLFESVPPQSAPKVSAFRQAFKREPATIPFQTVETKSEQRNARAIAYTSPRLPSQA
jgi:lysylphosphatidylglycerol synthetase-like protein (DUF2156 family)